MSEIAHWTSRCSGGRSKLMKLMTQLAFKGQCREAFEQYAKILGGTITVMNTLGGTDAPLPPGSHPGAPELIRFAQLDVGDQTLLGNDLTNDAYEPMRGFNVSLHTSSVDEATRIF